ncbi:MAG: type II secretion system F family protein [Planctomycetia bacterium]|jgi:type IV pilus assembly protein PilC
MSKFKYTAKDTSGHAVTGWINAEDAEAAREQLNAEGRGLQDMVLWEVTEELLPDDLVDDTMDDTVVDAEPVMEATSIAEPENLEPEQPAILPNPNPAFPSIRGMSILEDIDRLAEQGIPLGDGLRAIADELPSARKAQAIRALADRLDAGDSLQDAMVKLQFKLPRDVRKLIESGVSTGQFSVLLHQLVYLDQERRRLWNQSLSAVLYPGLLLMGLALFSILFGMILIPHFRSLYSGFDSHLPPMTEFVFWFFGGGQWILFGAVGLFFLLYFTLDFLPFPRWVKRTLYWIPLLGPIRRWHRLARCSRLLALLTKEQVPLPLAIRMAADGTGSNEAAVACREIADNVEGGMSFAEAAGHACLYPPSCETIVHWGETNHVLPESLEIVSDISKTRMQSAVDLMGTLACPLALMIFLVFVPLVVISLFMPMIRLVCSLSC